MGWGMVTTSSFIYKSDNTSHLCIYTGVLISCIYQLYTINVNSVNYTSPEPLPRQMRFEQSLTIGSALFRLTTDGLEIA